MALTIDGVLIQPASMFGGNVVVKNTSTGALDIQTAAGASIFKVDTSTPLTTITGLITANTGISLAASQKLASVSGVLGLSVVSTAYTLGSGGTVVLPNVNMSGAANDTARDVLAGNIDGAIAIDTGVAGRIYVRDAGAWKFALAT